MLFKEKLLLSNCDSVRKLDTEEIRKRFLTGLTFADGVVLSPNAVIDNVDFHRLITRKNVVKYLNEEGHGKLVIRGFNLYEGQTLFDYYNSLPDNFIISSITGSPQKSEITREQSSSLIERIILTQEALNQIGYKMEKLEIPKESLRNEVYKRIDDNEAIGHFFSDSDARNKFIRIGEDKYSRSQWYQLADDYFIDERHNSADKFKIEVIDPAYNSLFATKGEGFLQDQIKLINDVPEIILDTGVAFRSLRDEIKLIEYPIKAFEFITSLSAGSIIKFLTDEALEYAEDKLTEKGKSYLTRKNWFGMYSKMKKRIGLEMK